MDWLNPYGLLFMAVIMIPNVLFALRCRDGFASRSVLLVLFALLFAPSHILISYKNAK